jgi:hypothetical protein
MVRPRKPGSENEKPYAFYTEGYTKTLRNARKNILLSKDFRKPGGEKESPKRSEGH